MAARRRGLGDVLHHFISEEEQAAARARRRAHPESGAQPQGGTRPPFWVLALDARRPLRGALVMDLAASFVQAGIPTRVVAPPSPWLASPPGVQWVASGPIEPLSDAVEPGGTATLWTVHPGALPHGLAAIATSHPVDGVLLAIDPSELEHTASLLGSLPRPLPAQRLALLVLGAQAHELDWLQDELAGTSQVSELEVLTGPGCDPARMRSLLTGLPLSEIDASAPSTKSVRALSRALATP